MGIRADIEADLAETLESPDDFGMPVELISPDGEVQTMSANDPTLGLYGQVLYDTIQQDENGNEYIDHQPVVSLRITSLDRVPAPGEKWNIKIPISPVEGADMVSHTGERAPEDGRTIGFIRMILRKVEQSA